MAKQENIHSLKLARESLCREGGRQKWEGGERERERGGGGAPPALSCSFPGRQSRGSS